jgi:hypothetical protein
MIIRMISPLITHPGKVWDPEGIGVSKLGLSISVLPTLLFTHSYNS